MNTIKHYLKMELTQVEAAYGCRGGGFNDVQNTVAVKCGDNLSHEIVISLRQRGKPYVITDDTQAYLYCVTDGENKLLRECETDNGEIRILLSADMLAYRKSALEVRLASPDGAVLGTPVFYVISVDSDAYADAGEAIDGNDFTLLLEALAKAEASRIESCRIENEELVISFSEGRAINLGRVVGKSFTYEDFTEEQLASLKGETGSPGADGKDGVDGAPGVDGKDGADGRSAYDYAKDGGYEGSEAEFAELLSTADSRLDGIESQIADILYEAIKITSLTNNVGTAEIGSTIGSITVSWGTNKLPTKLTLNGVELDAKTTSVKLSDPFTESTDYVLAVTDERGATATKTTTLYFRNGIYYGAATIDEMADPVSVLTKELSDTKGRTFTAVAGDGEYVWYALPERLGECSFNVGGFDGGFELYAIIEATNASGYTESYRIYRSTNASLGEVTVKVA